MSVTIKEAVKEWIALGGVSKRGSLQPHAAINPYSGTKRCKLLYSTKWDIQV